MAEPVRVLIHNARTDDMVARLRAEVPGAVAEGCDSYADLPAALARFRPDAVYSVRFDGTPRFPRAALLGADAPRWLANGGVGTDHLGQWDPERITVTNAAGVAAGMMAEYILGGFLHFTLDVPGLQADQAARRWAARRVRPLAGSTLLIVGLGHTGRALAARAKALGMRVLGTRARPQPTDNVDEVAGPDALPSLLPQADFIAVCTPLVAATRGMIDASALACARRGAILADVSRGGVVDQRALHDALASGHLGGAVLDVFEVEPLPQDSPLWALDTVLISPHCASVYDGWEAASFTLFLQNLSRFIAGDTLLNIVDPARGY